MQLPDPEAEYNAEYFPESQFWQAELDDAAKIVENFPCWQGMQPTVVFKAQVDEYLPALQTEHADACSPFWKVPGLQSEQLVAPAVVEYFPGEQLIQSASERKPFPDWYFPAVHSEQAAWFPIPVPVWYFPGRQ